MSRRANYGGGMLKGGGPNGGDATRSKITFEELWEQRPEIQPGTRAVERRVSPGDDGWCVGCGGRVRFHAVDKPVQVLANVYVEGKWDRLEVFHLGCYEKAGEPWGKADPG